MGLPTGQQQSAMNNF